MLMKPTFNDYYMLVALTVRERANCIGRKVGSIIVKDNRIIGTGYNGTPEGMTNCEDNGCIRCSEYRTAGEWYDKCICVHAEQNAMITAARFGNSIAGSTIYSTLQPCFSCLKEMLQAKVESVYYLDELHKPNDKNDDEKKTYEDFINQYEKLQSRFKKMPSRIEKSELYLALNNITDKLKKDLNNIK